MQPSNSCVTVIFLRRKTHTCTSVNVAQKPKCDKSFLQGKDVIFNVALALLKVRSHQSEIAFLAFCWAVATCST